MIKGMIYGSAQFVSRNGKISQDLPQQNLQSDPENARHDRSPVSLGAPCSNLASLSSSRSIRNSCPLVECRTWRRQRFLPVFLRANLRFLLLPYAHFLVLTTRVGTVTAWFRRRHPFPISSRAMLPTLHLANEGLSTAGYPSLPPST